MATLIKTGQNVDLSDYLKLNETYIVPNYDHDVLTFKRNEDHYTTIGVGAIQLSTDSGAPNTSTQTYLNNDGVNVLIQTNTGPLQPLQMNLSGGINSQMYLRNYNVTTGNTNTQINIAASGMIIVKDFSTSPVISNELNLLQGKLNNKIIATESVLLQVPINATTSPDSTVTTLNLGTPTLLKGAGNVGNYISVASNVIKIKSTTATMLKFSGIFLGDFASGTGTDREFEFQIARPATPFDVVHKINKVKLTATAIADVEYSFKSSYTSGDTDPFFTDGFILRINNISGSNITSLTTRSGVTTISSLRIEILV